ncbi:hypothetical protein MKEN_00951400 [Mycena kentingensis (nom. inval.)]|nr:hypothetical protein MKEN_00951400 [Mycena kentingensis (nom. inval.)]
MPRIVHVGNVAHKYGLRAYEAWALEMLHIHGNAPFNYLDTCSQDMLIRVFEAAIAGEREDICARIENCWIPRLKSDELPLRDALDLGEKHDRRTFLGEAYYQQAIRMPSVVPLMPGTTGHMYFPVRSLKDHQLRNLLCGFTSIVLLWERLEEADSTLHAQCTKSSPSRRPGGSLVELLRGKRLHCAPFDIQGAAKKLIEADAVQYTPGYYCVCRSGFLEKLLQEIPDYFLGQERLINAIPPVEAA